MAFRCLRLIKSIRCSTANSNFSVNISRHNFTSNATFTANYNLNSKKEFKSEKSLSYLEDPDTFGTLSRKIVTENNVEDEGDIKEQKYLEELPLRSQKLTTRQYADIIKQFIKQKMLKEAIDVLEVRMLKEDRVVPENYIYNILIGACADVGYTKKAFKLFNDMKKRALKPTGDTYTCLFTACLNSPWMTDGLKNATKLRELMIDKGIEPNVTNYNVMIKTFGRCGDLPTAFKLVDEMVSKKIKIRVHTFNHLLHACISDKHNGLRHALVVWRKMLKMREKPNVHSFNLMLKCIKDCDLGSKEDINELIGEIEQNMVINTGKKPLNIESSTAKGSELDIKLIDSHMKNDISNSNHLSECNDKEVSNNLKDKISKKIPVNNELSVVNIEDNITMELVSYKKEVTQKQPDRTVPNLLSRTLQMDQVLALQDVHTLQDKFAIVGGQDDFFKEMEVYSVKPDIKIFTQMLPLIDNNTEAEMKLIDAMQAAKLKPDIDFFNLLIRKRCLRSDYDKAFEVRDLIEKSKKKRHPLKKKQRLKENIMTYGVLAMACRTKEKAMELLEEMKEKQVKVNIQILGTLLKHGSVNKQFEYVKYVMNIVNEENVLINDIFIQHLEVFIQQCKTIIEQNKESGNTNKGFYFAYKNFIEFYEKWLKEVNVVEALKAEHPWQQFRESYPQTVQRPKFNITQPKKFYKRNRKFVMYTARVK